MASMLREQFKLLELFKKKKQPDYPVTIRDQFEFTREHGYNPLDKPSVGRTRFDIVFSKYPEDPELAAQARKVRRLLALGIAEVFLTFILVVGITALLIHK
jgi:hypothetical protein